MNEQPYTHMDGNTPIDRLNRGIGKSVRWLTVIMVLLQFGVVLARYLFDYGSVMAQEAILYLFGTMFMLALADALAADRHVRVDMIYHTLPNRRKRIVDAIGVIVFLLPLCLFMLAKSWGYVAASWAAKESSREALGLPGVYLFKTAIVIALVMLILQSLAIFWRCISYKDSSDD